MILVIGGAGYIGSHVARELLQQGYRIVVLDNLSSGHREGVDIRAVFEYGDYTNSQDLERVFSRYSIDAVMHFAQESLHTSTTMNLFVQKGKRLASIRTLLGTMFNYHITNFILSSTTFIQEGIEKMLEDLHHTSSLNYIALRYFNAAGAHESGEIGEDHKPEVHLIPQVLLHLLHRTPLKIDIGYDTPDGTYIGDYLHVMDTARAHVLALESLLLGGKEHAVYTLGTGNVSSVWDIIQMAEKITGRSNFIEFSPLPNSHVPQIVIPSCNLPEEFGWKVENSLENTIASAWNWHMKYPNGYASKIEYAF